MAACPSCDAPVADADKFCEACGFDLLGTASLDLPAVPAADGRVFIGRWVSSSEPPAACTGCGGVTFGPEGYCEDCGQRRARAKDHSELDLGGIAAVTDRGRRHHRNEDAVALGALADTIIAIVCDGVSSSSQPDAASNGAVDAAAATMISALNRRASAADAIEAGTRAAQAAATLAAGPEPGANPPASTFVCAVVAPNEVTVGWVGDSRAYWIPDNLEEPLCLTVDDSIAGQADARGIAPPPGLPLGALVRWLGADATDTVPHLRTFAPSGPGRILVCSDGLFKYKPEPAELAAATPRLGPLETVRALVTFAIEAGGADNISAAVLPYPPPSIKETP